MRLPQPATGKYTGLALNLTHFGEVHLTHLLAQSTDTEIYHTDHTSVVVKLFDLDCGKADEISYGPYLSFSHELAHYEDLQRLDALKPFVPAYYGAHIDYGEKFAYVALEYLDGQDLKSWCQEAAERGYQADWFDDFRNAVFETLSIVHLFHEHGIILIDFKPDNIIRLKDKTIKFVDLGAVFTRRHHTDLKSFVYAATPDHAEVLIDASNLQTDLPPNASSDVFSAGVALFEMATGNSRLTIEAHTADEILANPAIFLFRDSQIRDLWRAYPHLRDVLPLLHTQLRERRLLFAEFWHLLKAYVAKKVPDWESLTQEQQDQIILSTGTTFILEQLPPRLLWLAGPIAHATVLRSLRVRTIADLMKLLAHLVSDYVREDVEKHNGLVEYLRRLDLSVEFVGQLNTWEVRLNRRSGHWAVATRAACRYLRDLAPFLFLKQTDQDDQGHRFWQVVDELEADEREGTRVMIAQQSNDHFAWIG